MANNPGNTQEAAELTLASATAAIITSRWNSGASGGGSSGRPETAGPNGDGRVIGTSPVATGVVSAPPAPAVHSYPPAPAVHPYPPVSGPPAYTASPPHPPRAAGGPLPTRGSASVPGALPYPAGPAAAGLSASPPIPGPVESGTDGSGLLPAPGGLDDDLCGTVGPPPGYERKPTYPPPAPSPAPRESTPPPAPRESTAPASRESTAPASRDSGSPEPHDSSLPFTDPLTSPLTSDLPRAFLGDSIGDLPPEPDPGPAPSFAASVMADLDFPEPFLLEPYEPGTVSSAGSAASEFDTYDGPSGPAAEPATSSPAEPGSSAPTPVEPVPASSAPEPPFSAPEPPFSAPRLAPPSIRPAEALPHRVPREPDVPDVPLRPNDPLLDPSAAPAADRTELSRIATYLREEANDHLDHRPDRFDVAAVLAAVQGVPGVEDATLRWRPGSGHTLRIEFDEGADPERVTQAVERLLRQAIVAAAPGNGGAGLAVPAQRTPATTRLGSAGPSVTVDHVRVTTLGQESTIEVRLQVSPAPADGRSLVVGRAQGPSVDTYLPRLAAAAAGSAIDQLLADPRGRASAGRCFVEHVGVVPFGSLEIVVVVLLLAGSGHSEQVTGSAIVVTDQCQAAAQATIQAVSGRLRELLG